MRTRVTRKKHSDAELDPKALSKIVGKYVKLINILRAGVSTLITENQKMVDNAKFIRMAQKLLSFRQVITDADNDAKNLIRTSTV